MKVCTLADCPAVATRRGMCDRHYRRMMRTGSPTGSTRKSAEDRFWAKVDKSGKCWIWTGSKKECGYGRFYLEGKFLYPHRFSYELAFGGIPEGCVIDHFKCYNPSCVNPDHLIAVSRRQNIENQRGAHADNKSTGIRGISWHKRDKKWQVYACSNWKTFHGGYFDDLAEAEKAAIELRNRVFSHNLQDRKLVER